MSRERVLVTGAGGQLGGVIVETFEGDYEVSAALHSNLDITDHAAVNAEVWRLRPAVVINCAAYNNVDAAEDEPATAVEINALAVRTLARAAERAGALFVHYSTDFVFDGDTSRPYTEDDRPSPRSVYAASKLLGEWFARDAARHYILRVESLFGVSQDAGGEGAAPRRASSVDRIVDAILEGRETRVFVDRTLSPSYTRDVAWATRELMRRNAPAGLYHCVNSGSVTWAGLAQEVANMLGREAAVIPVRVRDVPLRAERPIYAALSTGRLASLGIAMPHWKDALRRYLDARGVELSGDLLHQAAHLTRDGETRGQTG